MAKNIMSNENFDWITIFYIFNFGRRPFLLSSVHAWVVRLEKFISSNCGSWTSSLNPLVTRESKYSLIIRNNLLTKFIFIFLGMKIQFIQFVWTSLQRTNCRRIIFQYLQEKIFIFRNKFGNAFLVVEH